MGIRQTQFMGLNQWAEDFLSKNERLFYTIKSVHVLPDGTEIQQQDKEVRGVPSTPTNDQWAGMFDDGEYLRCYTLLDGSRVYEYVQADPWSSGPCIFLALKDDNGNPIPESLWDEDYINSY